MARFLKDSDYFQIKGEILKLLDGSTPDISQSVKLIGAEDAAIDQIKNRLSGRFNTDAILAPNLSGADVRDKFVVMIAVDMTLYHLYAQTGHKDVPTHRENRYQDAIEWLKDASTGAIATNLPTALSDDNQGEVRIWSASEPENHDY